MPHPYRLFLVTFSLGLSMSAARAEDDASGKIQTQLSAEGQVEQIRSRIETRHSRQADYHKKIAAGEFTANEDLRKQWPQIQAQIGSVNALSSGTYFSFIHFSVPFMLQCRPGDNVFLAATTGGAFYNGLSPVELQADGQGIAKTAWVSIGDAIGDCDITIYSKAATLPKNSKRK